VTDTEVQHKPEAQPGGIVLGRPHRAQPLGAAGLMVFNTQPPALGLFTKTNTHVEQSKGLLWLKHRRGPEVHLSSFLPHDAETLLKNLRHRGCGEESPLPSFPTAVFSLWVTETNRGESAYCPGE
jgi:hypothetical protein